MNNLISSRVNSKRLFIAIHVVPDQKFTHYLDQIKNVLISEKIRWVKPENYHITLRFLGDTDTRLIPEISSGLLSSLQNLKSFTLDLFSLGVFRSLYNPRVLWIGISHSEVLLSLKKSISIERKMSINFAEPD